MRTLPLLLITLSGCAGPWDPAWDLVDTDDTDVEDTAPIVDTSPPEPIIVDGPITTDTRWLATETYILDDLIFVEGTALLTIEAGTTIYGNPESALIITRDARLDARGRADAPIVFTSSKAPGTRAPGDWGGVVLLGNAPSNPSQAVIEGVQEGDFRGAYGGNDPTSNCGVLEFVRIEFPGFEVFANNELNGLTLGGCGSNTLVRNVHVHMTVDDGVEVFGGTVDLKNVLITRAGDDALDWDNGWQGRAQFVIIQMEQVARPDGKRGDNGIEADSRFDTLPRSGPTIYNLTMVGANIDENPQRGMLLREGTGAILRNVLMQGSTLEGLDVRDPETGALAATGELALTHSMLYDIGTGNPGRNWVRDESGTADDDDGQFDELAWLQDTAAQNRLGIDPQLPAAAFNLLGPNFIPIAGSPTANGAATPPLEEFFDISATYIGAVRPGTTQPWYGGWTAFPEN